MLVDGATKVEGKRGSFVTSDEALDIISQCAEQNAFAQLHFPGNNYGCGATIWEARPRRITLVLDADADPTAVSILGLCSIYFVFEGKAHLGLARLLSVDRGARDTFIVELEAPDYFSTAEPRTSERIPVPEGARLAVFVFHDSQLYRAKPINVSLGGMLLDVGHPLPGVELGSVIQVQASLDGISLTLPALVRWSEGSSYGLFFNTVAQYGQPSSCPELVQIVQHLLELQPASQAA